MGGKRKGKGKQQEATAQEVPKKEEEKQQVPAPKAEAAKKEEPKPVKKVEEKKASEIEDEKAKASKKEDAKKPDPVKEQTVAVKKGQEYGDELNTIIQNQNADGWGQQTKQQQIEDLEMQQRLQEILKLSQILQNGQGRLDPRQRKQIERKIKLLKPHAFWDNQPVRNMKNWARTQKEGPLENKLKKDVSSDPSPLPDGFEWCTIDLENDDDAQQVYTLLKEHYVEDSEGVFRFEYSVDLIRWVLCTPEHIKEWHVGLRNKKSQKLLGFISGTPCKVIAKSNTVKMAEINFLCVNRKLREKRMAPVLIKEVTRRVNLSGIWSAIYTSGETFPTPFTEANYFHRTLNPKKNVETGFSSLAANETMAKYVKKMKIHELKDISLIGEPRLMQTKDLPQVYALYKKQMDQTSVHFKFSQQELGHHLMPRRGVIYTIVMENFAEKKITDFVSFYNLPSQILKQVNHTHTMMNVAYLYYYGTSANKLSELMKYALLYAKDQVEDGTRFDVFNCLNIMDNPQFLQELKFGVGDGVLNYYMYNYHLVNEKGQFAPSQLGTVLV